MELERENWKWGRNDEAITSARSRLVRKETYVSGLLRPESERESR